MLSITSLERGCDRNNRKPGIIESTSTKGKNLDSFGMVRPLIVPVDGKTTVRLAKFSDKTMTIKLGWIHGRFYLLHRGSAAVNTVKVRWVNRRRMQTDLLETINTLSFNVCQHNFNNRSPVSGCITQETHNMLLFFFSFLVH